MIILRIRNFKNAQETIDSCPYIIKNPTIYKGKYQQLFNNRNPIHLEIGMGKGKFIIEMALKYPQINFIGIEKYTSIIARAAQRAGAIELTNLRLIEMDALILDTVFDHEISCIYLNFSDPWPKTGHSHRRLTSPEFLTIYDKIFKSNSQIVQKSDNMALIEYSIASFKQNGYILEEINYDLENSSIENIMTEYETKFVKLGQKIGYIKATKK